MNKILLLPVAALAMLCSCSGEQSDSEAPRDDQVRAMARQAAQAIATTDHHDTLKLQHSLVEAHAMRSELVLRGQQDHAELFDECLRENLNEMDPEVAKTLFP